MKGNLTVVFLVSMLMISACGVRSPAESTATPPLTESPTATQTPAFTVTLPVESSITPTPETPIPTNPPDCTNSAAFVVDVTIADNEFINGGSDFTKTWRIRNTGTCVWGPDYTLTYYSGDRLFAPAPVPLSVTYPGQTADISMKLSAPTTDGKYTGFFVVKNPAGLIMKVDKDSRLWVMINVSSLVVAATEAAIPVTGNGLVNAACSFTTDTAKFMETVDALNAYRAANGLPAYVVNEMLTKAATAHANDMACNKLFTHNGSDGSTPDMRVAASGYSASSVTENVYGSYPPLTGQGVVDWWKNDKTDIRHNQNLLSTAYTEIGVGYSFFNNFGYYVLVFAKPK